MEGDMDVSDGESLEQAVHSKLGLVTSGRSPSAYHMARVTKVGGVR